MIIESGIIIFLGFILIAFKLNNKTLLRLLSRPLLVDLTASAVAYIIHFGTFTGVMAAAVAALMMSATISICRRLFGFIQKNENGDDTYYVGAWDLLPDLHYTDGETQNPE
jgi:hypothetical protein